MTNKFISLMDGIRQGIASNLGTRCLRSDSVSIVSRQSVLLILLLCLTLGVGQIWGADVTYKLTIDGNDFNTTSYAANNNEKTSNAVCTTDNTKTYEVKWTSNQVMKNGNNMQWQKSKGYIYNSTDLGTITNVTVTSSAGSFTTYYGTSEQPSSGTTVGGGYFKTNVGGATGTTSKVEVTFTVSEGGDTPTPTVVKTLKSIAVEGMTTNYEVGDAFSFDGTCTATYSVTEDEVAKADEEKTVTPTSVTTPDMTTAGNKTITVSYTEDDVTRTAEYEITVAKAPTKSSLIFTEACGGSGTADDGAKWTVSSDGTESSFDTQNGKGIHYGTSSAAVKYIQLATDDINGTITKVVVNASVASGVSATVSVTVGGEAFGGDPKSLTASAAEYTFTGSASGEIIVLITKPSSATKAIYCKSVVVDYEACEELGQINGSVLATNQRSIQLQWDKMANVASYALSYKVHGSEAEPTAVDASNINATGANVVATISGLACSTAYDFMLAITGNDGYCSKDTTFENKSTSAALTLPELTYPSSGVTAGGSNITPTWGTPATTHDGAVTYASSNPSVLEIVNASTGEAKPKSAGTATVTATYAQTDTNCEATQTSNTITVNGTVDITFDGSGAEGTMAAQTVNVGEATKLNANTFTAPACKQFGGWATDAQGAKVYDNEGNITASSAMTLYAVWNTIQYTVAEADAHVGAASVELSANSVDCGGSITVTATADATHKGDPTITFDGTATLDGNQITNIQSNITNVKVTYVAKVEYTVTWDVNNGSEASSTSKVLEGNKPSFPEDPASCSSSSSIFYGWATAAIEGKAADLSGKTVYTSADAMPAVTGAVTYYAVFAKGTPSTFETVLNETFDNDLEDDGTEAISSVSDNFPTATNKVYEGANGTIKFGSSSAQGSITSKTLDLSKAFTVSLKAKKYSSDVATLYVQVGEETKSVSTSSTDPLTGEFKTFTFAFDGTEATTIKIGTSSKRAYIDDVVVTTGEPASATDFITQCAAVEAPAFSVAAGTYNEAQSVTLSCETEGADIYYTTDGETTPTSSSTKYTEAIAVNQSMTIKAIAIKDATESSVATAAYELKVKTPTIEADKTEFFDKATVTLTCEDNAATIYYAIGEAEAVAYTEPFEVNTTATVTAVAKREGWTDSENASQDFTRLEVLDVAGARDAIDQVTSGQNTEAKYVRGIISSNPTFDSKYNSLTYNISADGESTSDQLKVYSGKSYGGANFSSADDLLMGDEVVVYGTMKLYQSTTYQFNYDNQLVERKQRVLSIALSGDYMTECNEGAEFSHEGMVVTATYNYGDDAVVTANATWSTPDLSTEGAKTVTVSYTFDGKTVTKDYTITVNHVCASEVTITKDEEANGTFALSATGAVCGDGDGAEVEVTDIAPAEGYRFKTITATAGVVDNDLKKVTGIKANATIGVEFEQIPTHQVTWNVNGDETTKTTVQEGSKPVFPATPVSCDDAVDGSKTFIGWATAAWKGKKPLSEVSATIYTNASEMPAVSGVVTYYAVFAKGDPKHTVELTYEDFGLTASYEEKSITKGGFGFTVDKGYKSNNNEIQMNTGSGKGAGQLYNTSAIEGLKSVKVNVGQGNKNYTITTGTSQNPTDNSQQSAATGTFNALSGDTYFQLQVSGASYFSSIEVTYEEPGFEYEDYMTSCCTKLDALNLTKAMAQHTATLTWDAIAGVTEWSVSGNVKGGDAIAPANIGEITTINEGAQNQCIISNLTTNTLYEFQVSATSFGEDYCTDVNAWSIEGTTDADFVITAVASNDGAYGTVEVAGEVITATVAPYCRYATAGAYTVTSGAATVVKNGDVFTVTPESNCTVQINFEPIPVSSVTMDAELALEIGDVTTLVATVAGETGANPNVNWTVEPEGSVISLDNGEITALAAGTATITATSVSDNTKSASCVVTVTEHVITPGAYDITFCNAFFGTTGLDGSLTGANLKDYSGSKKDINVEYQKGTGSNMYLKDSEIRLYSGNALVVSVPEGYNITAITGLTTNINADKGSISGTSWSGKANTVTLRHKNSTGNSALTTINVTFAAIETYAVTFAAPVGGTLAIEDEGNAITSGDKFAEDKILDVTIEPATAYHGGTVKVVKTGVEPEEDVTESDYSNGQLTIKDYAITVSASFVPDAAISVAVADGQSEWGSVKLYDGNADEVSSGATFKPAADFMIEATPSDPEVYEFVGWAISAGSDIAFTEENAVDNDPALVAGEVSTTFTATFREKAAPYLEATKNALNFSTTAVNGNSQLTFDLTGENLAANATYEITGDDKAIFSVVSPAFPIAPEEGVIAETITVQYAPTAVSENHSATLTITSGAASVEIALSGSAALAYTAKWYVNGTEASTVTAFEGADLEFPANPASKDDCKNLTFVGWLTSTLAEASENAPQGLITETTGLKMPVNGVNYYAVFAEKEGEDVPAGYSLSNAAPAAGDQVIIARLVSETYYGLTTAATPSTSALTVSAGVVSEPANNVIWDVATAESGVYLRPTGASTGLHMNSDALKVANGDTNGDIKFSANGNGSFKGTRADDARWIVTSGANGLTCSATQANAAELYVFKYAAGSQATYSNYVTTCVLCNKVTLVKAGEDENNTFALQVNSTDVASVKTCEGDVAVNIVANPAIGNSVSFAISGETGATYNNNVITIPQSAAGELTVTATFSQIDYTVTMAQEGDASATISGNQENKHYGDEITVTAEAVEGYAFTGWTASPEVEFADASALSTTFTMPNSDVTVTANYTLIATCRISFQVNGAEVAFAEQTQAQEYTITKTGAAVEGFTFLGWSETEYADETEVLPAMIESYTPAAGEATKNLYGIYSRLDTSDPTVGQYVRATAVAEGDFLIVCETENVAFDGSLNKLNAAGNTQAVTISNNLLNLENADSYVFTVAAVSGGYSIKSKNGIYIGCTGSSNDMKESTETAYVNTISLVDNAFAITSSGGPKLQYYKSGANSQFKYYASNQKAIALYKKNLGTTYYTSSPVEKVTITFDANGGNGGCAKAIINKGTQLTICAEAPTKAQYDFTGWKNGDDVYVAGQAYTFNADITLTAQWTEASTYTVTYDKNGGEGPADNLEGKYAGDAITLPAALAKDEFTFQGWKYNNKLYAAGASFTMPAANVEFVAQYRKASIPVDKMSMVTSASALADGMQVALGCSYVKDEQSYFAMAGDFTGTNKYMASVTDGVSLADNIATYPSSVLVLTLEQVEGGWKIAKDDTHYLNETSVKNLTWATKELATAWTISFSGNNVLISSANGAIKYNSTDPRFTTYASGQKSIQLFGKAVVVTETASISDLGYTEGEAIIASGSNVTLTVDVPTVTPSVTAQNGATVVVNKPTTANEVVVENGSKIVANEETTTPTVYFATTMGVTDNNGDFHGVASELGEITNITLATGGEIIYDLTLGVDMSTPEGAAKAANQWHAFSLPFRVDALTGIYNAATGDKLTNEVDYAIMDYDGKIRANGQYGWKKFRGILEPGVFYLMTVNGDIQTFRFKATQTGAMSQSNSMNAQAYTGTSTNESDQGWNGFGNPRWIEGTFAHDVQYLDPYTYEYVTISQNETVPVGLPFFYKASSSGPVAMGDITSSAPARNKANEIKKVAVRFGNDESKDKLYISASEDALNTYEQDKDLVKMFMSQTPKVARISANAYGMKLCVVNAPMSNDQAVYDLTLYAPQAGEYTISVQEVENADIYLTHEGTIIWNLSMGAYTNDFAKGNTEGYGLLLQAKAPSVATGVDSAEANEVGVQKVIIEDKVFILRGGQMYDVTGKAVK